MKPSEYQEHIKRWYPSEDKSVSVNWIMGMAGELGEILAFDYDKQTEGDVTSGYKNELGDFLWYFTAELSSAGAYLLDDIVAQKKFTELGLKSQLTINVLMYVDYMKKAMFNGRDIFHNERLEHLIGILELFHWYLEAIGLSLQEIIDINVKKLTKRYGDDYSDKKSEERVDVKTLCDQLGKMSDGTSIVDKVDPSIEWSPHYKKGDIDPYQLFKSMVSSGCVYIDHLRTDVIKRMFRLPDKGQALIDARKSHHQTGLILRRLEEK